MTIFLFVSAGGITTLVDMPLNSNPSTVSEETLKLKVRMANFVWVSLQCIILESFTITLSLHCEGVSEGIFFPFCFCS